MTYTDSFYLEATRTPHAMSLLDLVEAMADDHLDNDSCAMDDGRPDDARTYAQARECLLDVADDLRGAVASQHRGIIAQAAEALKSGSAGAYRAHEDLLGIL